MRVESDGVDAVIVVDDAPRDLAYRAHVRLDVRDEWLTVRVAAWWRADLSERPVHPSARADALAHEMRRVVESDGALMQRLIEAHGEHLADAWVYDRLDGCR